MDGSARGFPVVRSPSVPVHPPACGLTMSVTSVSASTLPGSTLRPPCFDADLAAVRDWLGVLRSVGVRSAGPALILALEALRRAQVPAARRLAIVRLFKAPLLKTCAGLPKPGLGPSQSLNASAVGVPRRGVTLEQRLYRLMFQNLHQALIQCDRESLVPDGRQALHRAWVLHNLFRFCGRQLRYAALWGCRLPVNAWRDLHELYVYLMVRRATGPAVERPASPGNRAVAASIEYKQLLLFGLAAQLAERAVRSSAVMAGLSRWAAATVLEDPHAGLQGEVGLFVVEVMQDRPPQRHPGPLDTQLRGWVLLPPAEFFQQLEGNAQGQAAPPSLAPALRQSVPGQQPRVAVTAG